MIDNPHDHYRPYVLEYYDLSSLPAALEKAGLTWPNYDGYAFQYVGTVRTADHPRRLDAADDMLDCFDPAQKPPPPVF